MARRKADGVLEVALRRGSRAGAGADPALAELVSITYVEEVGSGTTYAINPEVEKVFGYSQEEWMGDADLWIERVHPDDRHRVVGACRDANLSGGDRYAAEFRMRTRDGRYLWVHDEAMLVRSSDGKPLCWEGVMTVIDPVG